MNKQTQRVARTEWTQELHKWTIKFAVITARRARTMLLDQDDVYQELQMVWCKVVERYADLSVEHRANMYKKAAKRRAFDIVKVHAHQRPAARERFCGASTNQRTGSARLSDRFQGHAFGSGSAWRGDTTPQWAAAIHLATDAERGQFQDFRNFVEVTAWTPGDRRKRHGTRDEVIARLCRVEGSDPHTVAQQFLELTA